MIEAVLAKGRLGSPQGGSRNGQRLRRLDESRIVVDPARVLRPGRSIKETVREPHVSRDTVREVVRSDATALSYGGEAQPRPELGAWQADLDRLLVGNDAKPANG